MTELNEEEKKPWQSKRPSLFPTYLLTLLPRGKEQEQTQQKGYGIVFNIYSSN